MNWKDLQVGDLIVQAMRPDRARPPWNQISLVVSIEPDERKTYFGRRLHVNMLTSWRMTDGDWRLSHLRDCLYEDDGPGEHLSVFRDGKLIS